MAGIEMKLRRAFQLLAGVALLGAIATYVEITRTTAQPSDRAVKSGEADNTRTATRSADPVVESSAPGNPRTAAQPSDRVVKSGEADGLRTAARSADPAVESSTPGNPLWALPLKQLSTTRERPIFSPSRRPPPPATPTYVAPVAVRQQVKPAEPERPAITLLGTIVGSADRIGVFLEPATRNVVRLRIGEDHQGWVLRSVQARDVTLVKDREETVLELPPPGEESAMLPNELPPGMQGMPGMQGVKAAGRQPRRGAPFP
jgi:hypothetical protein